MTKKIQAIDHGMTASASKRAHIRAEGKRKMFAKKDEKLQIRTVIYCCEHRSRSDNNELASLKTNEFEPWRMLFMHEKWKRQQQCQTKATIWDPLVILRHTKCA